MTTLPPSGRNGEYFARQGGELSHCASAGVKDREANGTQQAGIGSEVRFGPLAIDYKRVRCRR